MRLGPKGGGANAGGCWGKDINEALDKAYVRQREEADARKERIELHIPLVTDIQDNGDSVTVRFRRKNGEMVTAIYVRSGWGKAPRSIEKKMFGKPNSPRSIHVGAQVWSKPRSDQE